MQNHFALFHLPAHFVVDTGALDRAYREVQNQVHPDKFVNGSDAEKRVAMQWATRANEAYQTLKNPLKRAAYLCELNGVDLQTESNTAMPMAFLMQQMTWREALDEAKSERDLSALTQLETELKTAWNDDLVEAAQAFDRYEFAVAAQAVRKLMFLNKFREEISQLYELFEG